MRVVVINIAAMVIGAIAAVSGYGQEDVCDLKLKVYSYDASRQAKPRLQNVSIRLRGKGVDEKVYLTGAEANFKSLRERSYELEVSKPGYKSRRKTVELDCRLRHPDAVWNHTYLWRDKKFAGNDTDLVEDGSDDPSKERGTTSLGTADIAKAADKIFGRVRLLLLIDVDGNVVSATRVDGDRRLADIAIVMAKKSKFAPTIRFGEAVQVSGTMTYNFVP